MSVFSQFFAQWLPMPDHFLSIALVAASVTTLVAMSRSKGLPIFGSQSDTVWSTWTAPLTAVGSILGVVLLTHNGQGNGVFSDLNIFFGALVGMGSLLYAAIRQKSEGWTRRLWIGVAIVLILWAVIGEVLAALFLVNVVTPFITYLLRGCLLLTIPVAVYYVCKRPSQQSGKPPVGG